MTNHQRQREEAVVVACKVWGLTGVRTADGTVILTGSIASRAERCSAVAAAWAAPGVVDVVDRLELFYY